jgi:hypothetical protein
MTLFIACLLIYGLNLSGWFYPMAAIIWLFHLGYNLDKLEAVKTAIVEELDDVEIRKEERKQ